MSLHLTREGRRLHRKAPPFAPGACARAKAAAVLPGLPDPNAHVIDQRAAKVLLRTQEFARLRAFMQATGQRYEAAALRTLITEGLDRHGV